MGSIDYFLTLPILLAAAAMLQFLFLSLKLRWDDRKSVPYLLSLTATVAAVYLLLGFLKYRTMQFGLWDFGIYDSMLSIAAKGGGLMRDFRGGYFDHFSPAVLLLVPFYRFCDHPCWLIAFQALAMTAAGPLLYWTARKYFPRGAFPFLLTAMYYLNPYFSRMILFDFHIESLFPLIFFSAFFCYACKRFHLMLLFLFAAPLIKEDFVVPVAAAGVFLLSRRRTWRHGAAAIGIALFWTFFVLKIYYPHILQTEYWHYGRFELFAPTFAETWRNFTVMLGRFFSRNTLAVAVSVLLPFAFLPLMSWRAFFLLWLPPLGIQMISGFLHQQLLMSHYSSAMLAVTPVAALLGGRQLRAILLRHGCYTNLLRRRAYAGMAAAVILTHAGFAELPLQRYENYVIDYIFGNRFGILSLPFSPGYWLRLMELDVHAGEFRKLLDTLPLRPGDNIVCQNELGVELLRRGRVHSLPGPERPAFYLFDKNNYTGYDRPEAINALLIKLLQNPEYQCLQSGDGYLFFLRKDILNRK